MSMKKIKKDIEAISPVVATLMLVLVAVASVTAFYVFQSNWQAEQAKNVDNVDIDSGSPFSIDIAGSSTVYEFMVPAAEAYMDKYAQATVTVSSIGSGAGKNAIIAGQTDMGTMSKAWTTTDSTTYPTIVATTIAYDGVVVVIGDKAVAEHDMTPAMLEALEAVDMQALYNTGMTWGEFKFALDGTYAVGTDAEDIDPVVCYERADESGTEDGFKDLILGKGNPCNSDASATGNQGMIDAIAADADGIGFTSYGMAKANDSMNMFELDGVACTAANIKAEMISGNGYDASRPLVVLTQEDANEYVQNFLEFILEAGNNVEFCADGGFVSLYA